MIEFGNPLLSTGRIMSTPVPMPTHLPTETVTRGRIVRVTFSLFLLCLCSAGIMMSLFYEPVAAAHTARNLGFGGGVLGLSLVLLTRLYRQYAKYTAPVAALAGGVFMSGLALGLEVRFPGIAVQTVGITLAVFISMLVFYATGAIKVTRKFLTVVYTSTAAIAIVYLTGFVLILLGIPIPFLHGAGTGGMIWFSFIVIIASLNLVVDFQRIANLENTRQPECIVWYTGLNLLVTLVWLYISVLRLIANVRR
jgi:uncharacterized YccA/Bax inhibitor family protein